MDEEQRKLWMQWIMEEQQADNAPQVAYLKSIMSMPPDQQAKAFAELSKSYGERRTDLRGELERNYSTVTGEGPQGSIQGNNPFAYYTQASPLEHLAASINKYQAGKGFRAEKGQLEELNKMEEAQRGGMMSAYAAELRRKEEEEKRRRMGGWSGAN